MNIQTETVTIPNQDLSIKAYLATPDDSGQSATRFGSRRVSEEKSSDTSNNSSFA